MSLSDTQLRNMKATGKVKKVSDGGGLYLHLSPAGGKLWRMAYRFEGKQKTVCFGAYPAVSLKEAREQRDESKALLARGIDPSLHKQAAKAASIAETANAYEVVAREWYAKNAPRWTESNAERVLARQEKDVFPFIGKRPIAQISAPELLTVLRKVEERGALDTAHRILQDTSRIFRYAIATGRAERDPGADLKGALPVPRKGHFSTIVDTKEIGQLLRDVDAYSGNLVVRAALRLAPYVFVRPGELRKAEWTEFDLENAEWRIPAKRMKMRVLHIVPLSRQVLGILRDLHPYSGDGPYLFPSLRAKSAPISDMTLLAGLRRLGYAKEQMTVHGFRSLASTLLNEQGFNKDWIERQLAHGERNSVRASYNYAEYLPERRKMMQSWADFLDNLRVNNDNSQ